jgi:hypothetical protein
MRINSSWLRKGYAHGVRGLPDYPTESAIVGIVQNILRIYNEDGEISMEQLEYECGLLTGYLVSTVG